MRLPLIIFTLLGLMLLGSSPAFAFNGMTHEQIVRSTFAYLKDHSHITIATDKWIGTDDSIKQKKIINLLVRATVDEDYRSNVWLDASFHSPFAGAIGDVVNLFTTFTHHLNVSVPGVFWEHDGYAYRNTDGKGNDKYLGYTSVKVKGDRSSALGGTPTRFLPEEDLGAYRLGFKGTAHDWENLFYGDNKASDAVFPPATVPAELAYEKIMKSAVAVTTQSLKWTEVLPLASGIFSTDKFKRRFWREEIEGLPLAFDALGTLLHLVEDVSVPHHTQGIASYCHPEFEAMGDELSCGRKVDIKSFDDGTFDDSPSADAGCQKLYDATLVAEFRANIAGLRMDRAISISERLRLVALETMKWKWGRDEKDDDLIRTILPSGRVVIEKTCEQVLKDREVQDGIKRQYNFAVAASTVMLESAARDYERVP